MASNYDGLTVNSWTGTWSPSSDFPIVLSNEIRGGVQSVTGELGDRLTDISGQRLQDGMLVYVVSSYDSIEGNRWYTYKLLEGEARNSATGYYPNSEQNWTNFSLTSIADTGGDGSLSYDNTTGVITYTGPSATEVRAHLSVNDTGGDGSLSYDNTTGVITYTGPSATEVRAHFSVNDTGGDGSLSYDNTTGVITYTGPSATEVRAHISAGTGVTITDGTVAIGQSVETDSEVVFGGITVNTGNIDIVDGYISGPEIFTIDPRAIEDNTGTVVIAGNLQVDGTTTTINSSTLQVDDLNITLANGATNGAAANGAGITVDLGTDGAAFFNYDSTNDRWTSNKNIATNLVGNASTATAWETARTISLTGAVTGTVSGVDGTGNISIATTATNDPTLTLTGDASGSATFTNLGNATLTVTVADNSHNHDDKQNKMIISDTAPETGVIDTDQWWDSNEGILKVRFNDQWVESATSLASIPQGAGSGLDADLLDGLDSGAFIRSNANDTASGIITFTNTTDSTSSATGAVRLNGGLGVAKNIYAGADVFAYSDERLKENIELIPDAIVKVTALRGVIFNRKEDGERSTGVIAQDVQQVLPEAVHEDEAGMLSVKYGNMVGLLIEAMKEQQAQIDALKTEIQQLRGDK